MMSDVMGRMFVAEADRMAPRTPSSMETDYRPPSREPPFTRHRKTSSGFWNLDMEKLMAFPIEAMPPDEEMDASIPLSHKLPDHACLKEASGARSPDFYPSSYPLQRNSTYSSSDFDDGVDGMDGGSISWPPTPSRGSSHQKTGDDDYESDQDTVIEDEGMSCESQSDDEEEFKDWHEQWDMSHTLVDDETLMDFPFEVELPRPELSANDLANDSDLPDYVGIRESSLMSIPEDAEVCLDKTGNHVSTEEMPETSGESGIEDEDVSDRISSSSSSSSSDSEFSETGESQYKAMPACPRNDRIMAMDQYSQQQDGVQMPRTLVSHKEAVDAILERSSCNALFRKHSLHQHQQSHHQIRHRKNRTVEDFGNLLREDLDVACEFVLPDVKRLVHSSSSSLSDQEVHGAATVATVKPPEDAKASAGCCAGFRKIPTFGKARRRIEALGRAIRRHWPAITSAVVPIVLFFSCRVVALGQGRNVDLLENFINLNNTYDNKHYPLVKDTIASTLDGDMILHHTFSSSVHRQERAKNYSADCVGECFLMDKKQSRSSLQRCFDSFLISVPEITF